MGELCLLPRFGSAGALSPSRRTFVGINYRPHRELRRRRRRCGRSAPAITLLAAPGSMWRALVEASTTWRPPSSLPYPHGMGDRLAARGRPRYWIRAEALRAPVIVRTKFDRDLRRTASRRAERRRSAGEIHEKPDGGAATRRRSARDGRTLTLFTVTVWWGRRRRGGRARIRRHASSTARTIETPDCPLSTLVDRTRSGRQSAVSGSSCNLSQIPPPGDSRSSSVDPRRLSVVLVFHRVGSRVPGWRSRRWWISTTGTSAGYGTVERA
jgi:hypothetical protein